MRSLLTGAVCLLAGLAAAHLEPVAAAEAHGGRFAVRADATLETGDTFLQDGVRYRLWGVQACLPDTRVELASGRMEDCGSVSLAGLAGFLRGGTTTCTEIARSTWQGAPYAFVSCTLNLGGRDVELGTALIGSGLAFAALGPDGRPVHPFYVAAESVAREEGEGLWTAVAFDHPSTRLGGTPRKR